MNKNNVCLMSVVDLFVVVVVHGGSQYYEFCVYYMDKFSRWNISNIPKISFIYLYFKWFCSVDFEVRCWTGLACGFGRLVDSRHLRIDDFYWSLSEHLNTWGNGRWKKINWLDEGLWPEINEVKWVFGPHPACVCVCVMK